MDTTIIYVLAYLFCLLTGLLLWYFIWFKPGYCLVPEELTGTNDLKRAQSFKAQTLKEFLTKYGSLFLELDPNYWVQNIGLDGYAYLYLQRQILWILAFFFVTNVIIRMILIILYSSQESFDLFDTKVKVPEATAENNQKLIIHYQEQSILLTTYTIIIIFFMLKTLNHLRSCFLEYYRKTNSLGFKFLQLRTLHVQGIALEDLKGDLMYNEIKQQIEKIHGSVLAWNFIPNYTELVKLEIQRKDLLMMSRLIQSNENFQTKFWIPKRYRDRGVLEEEIEMIDDQIQKETEARFLSSGHAFFCFDSIKTMEEIYNFLSLDTKSTVQLSVEGGIDLRQRFINRQRSGRASTFMKFEDEMTKVSEKYKDVKFLVRTSPEPADIIWENLGGQINLLRKILATIASLIVLFFLTTPNEIFEYFNGTIIDLEHYSWAYNIHPLLGEILKRNGPSMLTLAINQVLLMLIDISAFYEYHTLHSAIQVSIFHKSAFYLAFNMLIIPGFSNDLKVSLFEIVRRIIDNPDILLTNFFGIDSALFFIAIILQSSLFSPMYYFLRITEFFEAYGSPWIAHYKRQFVQDEEKWRKQDSLFFQYGYFSAQSITIFFIISVFASSVPIIIPVGMLFFFNKHVVEGLNLLVLHKSEIDSFGAMIQTKIRALLICFIATTFFFMANWYKNEAYVSMAIAGFNLVILFVVFLQFGKPFFYLIELDNISSIGSRGSFGENVQVSNRARRHSFIPDFKNEIEVWKKAFMHPLIIKDEEFALPFSNPSPQRVDSRRHTIKNIELTEGNNKESSI